MSLQRRGQICFAVVCGRGAMPGSVRQSSWRPNGHFFFWHIRLVPAVKVAEVVGVSVGVDRRVKWEWIMPDLKVLYDCPCRALPRFQEFFVRLLSGGDGIRFRRGRSFVPPWYVWKPRWCWNAKEKLSSPTGLHTSDAGCRQYGHSHLRLSLESKSRRDLANA